MGRELNRMRDKLQRRSSAQAKATQPVITDVQISYGVGEGKAVMSFNQPIALLAMTPAQVRDMQEKLNLCLATIEAGK